MNIMRLGKGLLIIAALALTLGMLSPTSAIAKYVNISSDLDTCVVVNSDWSMNGNKKNLKLPRAIWYANQEHDHYDSACRKQIDIAVKNQTISMDSPLIIEARGSKDRYFTIRGDCMADDNDDGKCDEYASNGKTVFDASNVNGDSDCVIDIRHEANWVLLTNIDIINVPSDKHGICMNGMGSRMEYMNISGSSQAGGAAAFLIGTDSAQNNIGSTVAISGVNYGVKIDNTGFASHNIVTPYWGSIDGTIDDWGFLPLATDDMIGKFQIEVVGNGPEDWFVSKHPVKIMIIDQEEYQQQGYVQVKGFLVRDEGEADLCDKEKLEKNVQRIQVYSTGGFGADNKFTSGGFYGYIGEKDLGTGQTWGIDPESGFFKFRIPSSGSDSRFLLVPEANGGDELGSPSRVIQASDDDSAVECPDRKWKSSGNGNGGADDGFFVGDKRMQGRYHCCVLRGIDQNICGQSHYSNGEEIVGETLDETEMWDTDGDGKADDSEDLNWNCVCDDGETCYFDADSDNDGVPDGAQLERELSYYDAAGVLITDPTLVPDDAVGLLNGLIQDIDNDGLADGKEDRTQHYSFGVGSFRSRNYLFNISVNNNYSITAAVKDENGKPVDCELSQDNEQAIGVGYDLYTANCANPACTKVQGKPVRGADWDLPVVTTDVEGDGEGATPGLVYHQTVHAYACRNVSLGSSNNFNGKREVPNYELDPKDNDTDDDTFPDGDDPCPLFYTTVNTEEACREENKCSDLRVKDILWGIDPDVLTHDQNGAPTGYIMEGGVPKFFNDVMNFEGDKREKLLAICQGDMDGDGVKDCVEQPSMSCPTEEHQLKYWDPDSDNDTIPDLEDVCPESNGTGDRYSETKDPKTGYSCNALTDLYAKTILDDMRAFIWDRDGDGLYDYEEDRDLNGKGFTGPVSISQDENGFVNITEEDLKAIETNPMKLDTDDDQIDDYLEVKIAVRDQIYFSNPRNPDTDGDTLLDGEENRDGQEGFNLTDKDMMGSEGCVGMAKLDTDPTSNDTDRDGLQDGVELDGYMIPAEEFTQKILDDQIWDTLGGFDLVSNPRSTDSDNDGMKDAAEYNGIVKYKDSNPCMRDSDADNFDDIEEEAGCRLNPDSNCVGGTDYTGIDSDSDGLSNNCEAELGTDPNEPDSDGDGLWDGDEDINHNCTYEPNLNETNPVNSPDTDGDGLNDGYEVKYGTDPTNQDTDSDCLPDGMEDKNLNGQYDMGAETNALSADTDGDGLPDGWLASTGLGEDINCNGVRDTDGNGNYLETDPINPDSDGDGKSDGEELGGIMANRSRALNREGCSIAGVSSGAPSSMYYLLGMLLAATRIISRRMKKKTSA